MRRTSKIVTNLILSQISKTIKKTFSILHPYIIKILITGLLFGNLLPIPNIVPIYAQNVVNVTADQPNIWTLEQAHYLLAQMHRRNLDIKAQGLDPLKANEINGINVDILKSILDIGATYDEAARFNNNLIRQDKTFDSDRRRQLRNDIDELNKEKLELMKAIATLKRKKANAESDDEAEEIQAQIDEKTEIKTEVEAQIESKRSELSTLSSANGQVANTTSNATFDASKFPSGFIDDKIKAQLQKAIEGLGANPSLNASLQLDKFLGLQYEIISKQLTLLRDEVGPGEKLLFLELPQSINAPHDKSNKMWAQSRWRISGYTGCKLNILGKDVPCRKILYPDGNVIKQNRPPRTTLDIFESATSNQLALFDNKRFSLFDIKDREKLAKRFVERGDEEKAKSQRFQKLFQRYLTIQTNEEKEYAQFLADFTETDEKHKEYIKKNHYENKKKECDKKYVNSNRTNEDAEQNTACKKAVDKEIETIEKKLKDLDYKISNPSNTLLNQILDILNKAVEDKEQLNKSSELNNSSTVIRNIILSKIEKPSDEDKKLLNRLWLEDFFSDELFRLEESDFGTDFYDLTKFDKEVVNSKIKVDNRMVRAIEIIPRQSSLNVNDIKVRNKSSVMNFIFSSLFGIGANFKYQQQREQFSQFVQQELYSSGFGKGSREFGWTFTSMPGTNRLLSGTRNTYAIVIVPQEATSLVIQSKGCAFRRSKEQPKSFDDTQIEKKEYCGEPKNFVVPIPGGGNDSSNDFFVSGMTYESVEKGKRIVVSVYGENFSHQIGVMVDGVPLLESLGLAQNFIRDDSGVAREAINDIRLEKVKGRFERVDANQIVMSFEVADGKDGTPLITLISPGKSVDLNTLDLYINGRYGIKLKDAEWMFGNKPSQPFKISDAQIFVSDKSADGKITKLTALITGESLVNITNVFVNGVDPISCVDGSFTPNCPTVGSRYYWGAGNAYQITFPPPKDEKIQIVFVSGNSVMKLNPISNPAVKETKPAPKLDPSKLTFIIKKTIPFYDSKDKIKPTQLLVEIEGKGFNQGLEISSGVLDVVSDNKAFITISDPKLSQTIKLTDNKENIYATAVVDMAEILQPTPTPKPTPTLTPTPSK